ncbi:carboxypeptidase M32 [Geminicoccaceae bacterium 1502E]|nr:carboxypeptidase M32 [Geminicoccaceae bacterium 1502E]
MGWHYAALEDRFRRIGHIEGALSMLHWDTAVVMPRKASAGRGEQLAALKRSAHDLLTAEETGELVAGAAAEDGLDPWQAANLREMTRRYRHARAIEPALVEAFTRATTVCEMTWREARASADFAMLQPHMEEVVRLVQEMAGVSGAALGLSPYDALLDSFQPDLRDERIAPLFAELAEALPPIIESALAAQGPAPQQPRGPFPIAAQRALARRLMERLGFDFEAGRLDESTHPFCGGVPGDIRITTRYREDEVASALMGVLHETGHALYEAGLPQQWLGQPVGEARGMAAHESQSLLIEMQACRSPAFIRFMGGELASAFGEDPAFAPDNMRRLYHRVARSHVRVDADEATYPLHVVLRWRLERAMVTGDLAVADLPAAWNDGMKDLLGIVPPNDALGCLQDIHWPSGAFGYFPCYTLGAMLAAQLFEAAQAELGDLDPALEEGRFGDLLGWLREKVHGRASQPTLDGMVRDATGEPLGARAFLDHLRRRYVP